MYDVRWFVTKKENIICQQAKFYNNSRPYAIRFKIRHHKVMAEIKIGVHFIKIFKSGL